MKRRAWLVVKARGRGLYGCEFRDTYGARVRLSDSSAADEARIWVWVDGGGIVESGGVNDGSIHLSREQATEMARVLSKFARDGHLRPPVKRPAKRGSR